MKESETTLRKYKILEESVVVDTYTLYIFLRKLTIPFNETDAFKLGLIDANGKILKKRADLRTTEERNAFTLLDLFVWNLKKILEKIPFGKTKLASFAAALFFLKEEQNTLVTNNAEWFEEDFMTYWNKLQKDQFELQKLELFRKSVEEDAAANNAGSGAIAGINPNDTPGGSTDFLLKRKKKLD